MPEDHYIITDGNDPRTIEPDIPNARNSVFSSATPLATDLQEIKYMEGLDQRYNCGDHAKRLPTRERRRMERREGRRYGY